jgi:VWFA-related protein
MGLNHMEMMARSSCVALLCLPVFAFAQQPPAPIQLAPQARIHLDVVVADQAGKPISGLGMKDFTLLDNNQPARIASLQAFDAAKGDPPVEVIVLLDALNPSSKHAGEAQKALVEFLRQNGGHLAEPVSIYSLSDAGFSATPEPSTDGNALAALIAQKKGMRVITEHTDSFRPAAYLSFQNQMVRVYSSLSALGAIALIERPKPGRKILIWIGNGWPVEEISGDPFPQIVEFSTRLREARIALYRVTAWPPENRNFHYQNYLSGVKSATQAASRDLAVEVLATETGGRVLEQGADLAAQLADCIAGAGTYYALSFDPPRTSVRDEYHDLHVQMARPDLAARTFTGYYDEPDYYDQPYVAADHRTVEQLEQLLTSAHSAGDAELARRLEGIELTERMSSPRLASWKDRLPGPKSWAALVVLADTSAFLPPPAAEIPATPAPDKEAQRQMLAQAIHYLSETVPRLPNLFATRTTAGYAEQPKREEPEATSSGGDRSLHLTSVIAGTVLYRNGDEAVDSEVLKGKKPKKEAGSLTTKGTFGPILTTVILDGAGVSGAITWSRWEQGASGPEAVFRIAIPHGKSHFEVTHCCMTDGSNDFQDKSAYHGEITLDPTSGAILRLALESDLPADATVARSATMVEYGPQVIGGTSYICPLRSVSLSRGRRMMLIREWGQNAEVPGPYETVLNDVSFEDYHIFRSQTRLITGGPPQQEQH